MELHLSYSVFSDLFEEDVMNIWDYETSVNQYNATGGTGLVKQIQELTEWLYKTATLKRTKIGFQDQLSLNAGQKNCRMLHIEHYAIL